MFHHRRRRRSPFRSTHRGVKQMTTTTDWFHTTPTAVLRAESIVTAFREDRVGDIGLYLAQDHHPDADPLGPVHVLVALIALADRLADHAVTQLGYDYQSLVREAARVVAQAAIDSDHEEEN